MRLTTWGIAWRTWVVLCLGLCLGLGTACEVPPEVQARAVCTTLCKCTEPSTLPAVQDACVETCAATEDLGQLPEDCAECIYAHADTCGSLIRDCEPICDQPEPPTVNDAGVPL